MNRGTRPRSRRFAKSSPTGKRTRETGASSWMAMYISDMKLYLGGGKKDNDELKRNIDLNKKWAEEGK